MVTLFSHDISAIPLGGGRPQSEHYGARGAATGIVRRFLMLAFRPETTSGLIRAWQEPRPTEIGR